MMTRYAIRMLPGETQPCAVADGNGCFYSVGEVDRLMIPRTELDALLKKIDRLEHPELECPFCQGTGRSNHYNDPKTGECRFCDGTGIDDGEETK